LALSTRNPLPIAQTNPKSPITEAYRTIRTNIQFASVTSDVQVILTTSSSPSEGKTSTSANLAVVYAQAGKKVLLIDGDLRKPQLHQRFRVSNLNGLSSVLIKERTLQECIVNAGTPGLYLLPSGPIPPNPAEMLSSATFAALLKHCREVFDFVIIDAPPVLPVADALIVSNLVDGVVFVVDSQSTNRVLAKKAVQALEKVNAKILGVVLNRVKRKTADYYYYHYYSSDESVRA
jgi:capsular exopolysaccharide synthesis family protein